MARAIGRVRVVAESDRKPVLPSAVLGMLIFVFAEVMLFAGLISAFTIVRAGAVVWPPPGQPRLPVENTAFNTAALLLSGVMLWRARSVFRPQPARALRPLLASVLLGAFFVATPLMSQKISANRCVAASRSCAACMSTVWRTLLPSFITCHVTSCRSLCFSRCSGLK